MQELLGARRYGVAHARAAVRDRREPRAPLDGDLAGVMHRFSSGRARGAGPRAGGWVRRLATQKKPQVGAPLTGAEDPSTPAGV
ncbi:hypothetical protein GCM10009751_23130 [Myceligenerans crystallogenes]|uniref:Uncharacterized protein n=1 Tax=Myceligenerans crystallogenes TaxID=316335 RepID=A0ABP4ZMT8_9MICO